MSGKTRLNDLSYGIKIWSDLSFVWSQFTRLTDGRTDGQTDRQTDGQLSHRYSASALYATRKKNDQDAQLLQRDRAAGCVIVFAL